jgi:4-diphosphocytidyl-2-C-methyl-D-erythritol kinase
MGAEETPALKDRAPAKVNLSLHVLGRRADGYHELDSLVAFADIADELTLDPALPLSLAVTGPTAQTSGPATDNLVLKAARALVDRISDLRLGTFALTKNLPAAAGIGGGSSDAAAALRLIARLNGLAPDDPRLYDAARSVGADVPVCLDPQPRMMRGAGERLGPALRLPPIPALLVNPGVPVETAAVFRALGLQPGEARAAPAHPPIADDLAPNDLLTLLRSCRNDLEPQALALQPVIAAVLQLIRRQPGCRLARMSGSGATCFGVFDAGDAAAAAAKSISAFRPDWWVRPAILGRAIHQ